MIWPSWYLCVLLPQTTYQQKSTSIQHSKLLVISGPRKLPLSLVPFQIFPDHLNGLQMRLCRLSLKRALVHTYCTIRSCSFLKEFEFPCDAMVLHVQVPYYRINQLQLHEGDGAITGLLKPGTKKVPDFSLILNGEFLFGHSEPFNCLVNCFVHNIRLNKIQSSM